VHAGESHVNALPPSFDCGSSQRSGEPDVIHVYVQTPVLLFPTVSHSSALGQLLVPLSLAALTQSPHPSSDGATDDTLHVNEASTVGQPASMWDASIAASIAAASTPASSCGVLLDPHANESARQATHVSSALRIVMAETLAACAS
jgi:hypothetical protein